MAHDPHFLHSAACEGVGIKLREAHAIADRQGKRIHAIRVDNRRMRRVLADITDVHGWLEHDTTGVREELPPALLNDLHALNVLLHPETHNSPEAIAKRQERQLRRAERSA